MPDDRSAYSVENVRETRLPYSDVRVVEFTHIVMGLTCGMLLANFGAEVIKVEPLKGDNTRKLLGPAPVFFRSSIATKF
jgi:crotonobetainyl-CoA:carnitine CoA-transferase CaiB-like acyl-CoA transferase